VESTSSLWESSSGTLLAVDDDPVVLQMICRTLEPRGASVLTALSGEKGLALAEDRGSALDLVLTDLHLADMSGRDIAQVLGQYRPQLPVGFTTDLGDVEPSATTLQLLAKPFSPGQLVSFIERLLRNRRVIISAKALLARAADVVQQSRRLTDAVRSGRHARWAVLAQTGQLRAAARELRAL
jgi:DNA-binding response OmpR family regulator